MHRTGVELATSRSQVRRPDHYTTEPYVSAYYIPQPPTESVGAVNTDVYLGQVNGQRPCNCAALWPLMPGSSVCRKLWLCWCSVCLLAMGAGADMTDRAKFEVCEAGCPAPRWLMFGKTPYWDCSGVVSLVNCSWAGTPTTIFIGATDCPRPTRYIHQIRESPPPLRGGDITAFWTRKGP